MLEENKGSDEVVKGNKARKAKTHCPLSKTMSNSYSYPNRIINIHPFENRESAYSGVILPAVYHCT